MSKDKKDKKPFKETGIGKFLTEKAPNLIGGALELVGDLTGKDMLENIGKKIKGSSDLSPEDKAEALALLKLDLEEYKLDLEDRQDARAMNIETSKSDDALISRFPYILSAFIIISAVLFGVMLFFVDVPEQNKRLVEMFADVFLFGGAITVIQFFFGSSKGSKDKGAKLGE